MTEPNQKPEAALFGQSVREPFHYPARPVWEENVEYDEAAVVPNQSMYATILLSHGFNGSPIASMKRSFITDRRYR